LGRAAAVKVIIPAAGLGSRFLPLSRVVPKELLLLGDRPLIHHALCEAELAGFEAAVIVVSPGKEAIKWYFTRDPDLEGELASRGNVEALARLRSASELAVRMSVEFVVQPEPKGLGDAVLRCAGAIGSETCGVLLPDDVILGREHWRQLFALHARSGAAGFCLRQVPLGETMRYGIAECVAGPDGLRVTRLVEKPMPGTCGSNLAVLGRYVITPTVMAALRERAAGRELELADGFAAALRVGETVMATAFSGVHFDCGTPDAYARSVAESGDLIGQPALAGSTPAEGVATLVTTS
jgi:UTP--glucose-1-phosphate uridylyltransferase